MNTTNQADQIEHLLRRRHTPGLPEHFVLPHYTGYSIANLAPTVAALLGDSMENAAPTLPEDLWAEVSEEVNCILLLILDALGYRQLVRYLQAESSFFDRLVSQGRFAPITSVFPSTTVTALTSIWTGRPPLGHGFMGTKLLLPEQGVLANMLKMAPAMHRGGGRLEDWGWDPEAFMQVPTLAGHLDAADIPTVAHTRLSFLGSTLTRVFLRGMDELRGYVGLGDLWVNLRQTLVERDQNQPLFVDVYWGGADNAGHVYGPENEYESATLRHLSRSMEEDFLRLLPADAREGTLLIVTADHGQIATPADQVVHLPDHPDLWQMLLLPPAGESRASYLYVRPGQQDRLRNYVDEHLSDQFVLMDTERALEAGLWGPPRHVPSTHRARLGDVLLIAQHGGRLTTRRKRDGSSSLRGHHGGLTAEEMLVPLLMVRLDRL
jgi:hypothetical protein